MPKQKPVAQYGTLDVLLMMLLYNAKKAVQIPAEVFKRHSLFFANHHTVSVSVQWPDNEKVCTGIVTLKCTDKRKLRRLIDKYLSLYRKNKISSTETVLGTAKTDAILARFVFLQSCKHGKITFEFTSTDKHGSPSAVSIYPLDTASFVMACSYNGFPVTGIKSVSPTGKTRIEVEVDASALWPDVRSHIPTGWRVRLNSTQARYQGHPVTFDKCTNKQKKLLDMLVSSKNGVVKTNDVIKNIPIDDTNREGKKDKKFAEEKIRGLYKEIKKKVKTQCEQDGYGEPNFHIEVESDYVRLIDTSPV